MGKFTDRLKKAAKGLLDDSDNEKDQPQQQQQQQQHQQQQTYQQQPTYPQQQTYQSQPTYQQPQQPQHSYQQQQAYQQQQSDEEDEDQQQQAYRQQQSDDDDDDPQQTTRGQNFQQEDDDEEDQQYQGQQAQYGAEDDDDENDGNTRQMQQQTLNDDDDEEDYEGNTRYGQQAQDDDDENGVDQDAEDLAAPDDDDTGAHHPQQPVVNQTINIVVKEDRPVTQNAQNSELAQAGMLLMKQMLAQQTNSFGGHKGKLLTHQDVQHEVVDEHDQDWRIMMLTTSNHRGQVFQLEAKMDTGADLNFMNAAAARGHQIDYDIMEGPEMPSATVGSGGHVSPDGIATVKYTAGVHQKTYTEDFYISEGVPHDVILGKPFLEHAHAITLNPEFAKPTHKPDFLLFELSPMDEKKAKEAEEFRKQKQAEREARRNVRGKK